MDIPDYITIVFDRIQKFEPEHATKIMGYLLLQDHGEQEMATLASCPDHVICQVAFQAKIDLRRLAAELAKSSISFSPPLNHLQGVNNLSLISPRNHTSPPSFHQLHSHYWDPQSTTLTTNPELIRTNQLDSITELEKQIQLLSLENHTDPEHTEPAGLANEYYYSLDDSSATNFGGKVGRRFSSLSEFPVETCHYFNKGFCKNGTSCKYYHGQVTPDSFSHMCGYDEDREVSPGKLAQLESEIVELLKPRRGHPISIAALPLAYYDKYKKVLQADGYLTESQRHSKSGYSLTKLLARLKNSVCLIERPHGQHAVVLAEDAPKYLQKGDFFPNISASRQIYLTFPADSTFTEEDVSNYFSAFGYVEDVRIPYQQRRMFGFVTFDNAETVKTVLEIGNPHYICESRVLAKPYKEKAKSFERKYTDRNEHPDFHSPNYVDMDSEFNPIIPSCVGPRFLRRLLIEEEQEQALELRRRQLAELQLFSKPPLSGPPHLGFSMDGFRVPEDHFNFQPAESLRYVLNDQPRHAYTNFSEENSLGLNLPDSPFEFPKGSDM